MNRIVNLFLLLIGILSLTLLITGTFGLLFPQTGYLWVALLCTALWLCAAFRRGPFVGMPLCAFLLWYLYQYQSTDLLAELRDMADCVGYTYFRNFSSTGAEYAFTPQVASHMTALLFLLFLIAAFTAVSMHAGSLRISLSLLGTLPFAAICIAVNGSPSPLAIIGLAVFWFGLFLGGDAYHPENASGKAAAIGLIPCAALLALLLAVYRPSAYIPEERDFSLSRRFDRLGNTLSDIIDGEENPISILMQAFEPDGKGLNGWDTGDDRLDLAHPYDHSVRNHEVLHVKTDHDGSLYLRSRSYGEYTGTAWLAPAEDNRTDALSIIGRTLSSSATSVRHSFTLTTDRAYEALFLPYFSITGTGSDVKVPSNALSSYGGDYYLPGDGQPIPAMTSADKSALTAYQDFVHRYYTRLPDSTTEALRSLCAESGLTADRRDIFDAVANFVRDGSVYDTNVPIWQTDDFALYFLTTARRGYCIHYASSACALFRALLIPARVAEGFLINVTAGEDCSATGADAHAWVEVWMDGIGWVPVEVTRATIPMDSAASSEQPQNGENSENPDALPSPDVQSDPTQPESEQVPVSPDSSPADGAAGTEESANNPGVGDGTGVSNVEEEADSQTGDSSGSGNTGASASHSGFRTFLRAVAILLLVIGTPLAAILLRYLLVRRLRESKIRNEEPAKQAIEVYLQAERAIRHSSMNNLIMPEQIRLPAERAFFSNHAITTKEAQAGIDAFRDLIEEIWCGLSRWQRLLFRYIWCDY